MWRSLGQFLHKCVGSADVSNAAEEGISVVRLDHELAAWSSTYFADAVHLGNLGHQLLADNALPVVSPLL